MKHAKPLIGVAALALATGIALPTFAASGNKYPSVSESRDCGSGDTVALNGPATLWPPNHKFVDEPVTASETDGQGVTISVWPEITDAVGGDGGPQHDPDANASQDAPLTATGNGSATAALQLRAERSGKGDGRTYTIHWTATFHNGLKSCSDTDSGQSPFTVTVPHDMGGGSGAAAAKQ